MPFDRSLKTCLGSPVIRPCAVPLLDPVARRPMPETASTQARAVAAAADGWDQVRSLHRPEPESRYACCRSASLRLVRADGSGIAKSCIRADFHRPRLCIPSAASHHIADDMDVRVRIFTVIFVLAAAACSAPSRDRPTERAGPSKALQAAASAASVTGTSATKARKGAVETAATGPFSGIWEDCRGASSPDECGRYVLMQRGSRICGSWSYVATGDGYEGRVVAIAKSPTEAQRVRVCGRPGSETRMECEAGWEPIDKPLRLCNGKLADSAERGSGCQAHFESTSDIGKELERLAEQSWMQACLEGTEPEATP